MARVTAEKVEQSKRDLLRAAQQVLVEEGFAGLSTRRVAAAADTQMSQIQYHFGSKEGMILALFEHMNAGLVSRQATTFDDASMSLSQKWLRACDYLEEDFASGYVRVFQELIAAGWSNPKIGDSVRTALGHWHTVLTALAQDIVRELNVPAPFTPESIAALIAAAFVGTEALILLGYEDQIHPLRQALRQIGEGLAALESQT